jgi:ribonuclease J
MNNSLKIIPLGGLGEIGKNMMLIEYQNEAIAIDCGVMFPREEHVGVDVIIPNFEYLRKNINLLKAVFITHGHEDHIGAVPYLLKEFNVPVYCSQLTKGLIGNKIKEHRIQGKAKINLIENKQIIKVGKFELEFFSVAHSIPDAGGFIIKTPIINIVHTGDFKIDNHPIMNQFTDIDRLKRIDKDNDKDTLLLADSTYAEIPGHTQSEKIVAETIHKVIKKTKGRIILSTFASLISRIQITIDAAEKNNRRVFVTGTSMVNNVNMAKKLGYLKVKSSTLVNKNELKHINQSNLIIICTGSQGEPTSVLTRMANGTHQNIEVKKNDTVILSSNPVPGNEMSVSRNIDKLFNLGANVIYNKMENVHVRGHASMEELSIVHKAIKPKYFAGIHGEMRHLHLHKELAIANGVAKNNAFVLENGDILEVSKNDIKLLKKQIPAEYIYVDGKGIGDVDDAVLLNRNELAKDGVIVCKIHFNNIDMRIIETEVFSYGVIKDDNLDELHNKIIDSVEDLLDKKDKKQPSLQDENQLSKHIENCVYKFIRRRPLVLALLIK